MDITSAYDDTSIPDDRYTRDTQLVLKDIVNITGLSDGQIKALAIDPRTPFLNVDLLRMSIKMDENKEYAEKGFEEDPYYQQLLEKFMMKKDNPGEAIFKQRFKDSLHRYFMLFLTLE